MLLYEHERTAEIVRRLIMAAEAMRTALVAGFVITFGALFTFLSVLLFGGGIWWVLGIVGLAAGYVLGSYAAALCAVCLEWMAQMLVAQGALIAKAERR